MSFLPAVSGKRSVAQALELRGMILKLAREERSRCFASTSGYAVIARHTFRADIWRVHFLDGQKEPVAGVDASTYVEALYLAHVGGAQLTTAVEPTAVPV